MPSSLHRPFRIRRSADGGYYWALVAGNGETLAHSETYTTKANARGGVLAVIHSIAEVPDAEDLLVDEAAD